MTEPEPRAEPVHDRWGRYRLPSPLDKSQKPKLHAWTRVSTVIETPSDPFALFEWKQRKAALGFAADPKLLPRPDWDVAEYKAEINKLVSKAMEKAGANKAADAGSDFHAGAAFLDESGILPKPTSPMFHPLLAQYKEALERYDLVPLPEFIERTVVIPGADRLAANVGGVAGTLDRIFLHKPSGKYIMADLKTRNSNSDLNYNCSKWGLQLYAYGSASHAYNWDSQSFFEMPKLAPRGVIISVDLRSEDPDLPPEEEDRTPRDPIKMFRFTLADYKADWEMALALRAYRSASKKRTLERL